MRIQIKLLSAFVLLASATSTFSDQNVKRAVNLSVSAKKEVDSILDIDNRIRESKCENCREQKSQKGSLPKLTASFWKNGADCTSFIDNNGNYGIPGKEIQEYVNDPENKSIFFKNDIPGITGQNGFCGKWPKLSNAEKTHFWVWFMASLAFDESTCVPTRKNRNATNGVGVGYFQLEESKKDRQWRGDNCETKSVLGEASNTNCAMDILVELLKGRSGMYKSNGHIYGRGSNSYWQKLKLSSGGQVGARVREFPLCK